MMPHLQAMHPVPEQSYRVRTVPYPHEELRSGTATESLSEIFSHAGDGVRDTAPSSCSIYVLIFGTACTASDSAIGFY